LRSAGLSRPKAGYIHDLAQKSLEGLIPSLEDCDGMTDAEVVSRFTAVKGVGRWTAEMLLIFNLGRPDVLPVHDLGIQKGYKIAYRKRGLPEPSQLDRFGARWSPYRSTAALYLWKAADFLKGEDW
jgi:3-methyladenine DNA glycosylase/8-oxoguanine DNA glycosylase